MRPYLAALAVVTLCGVAPHAALQQDVTQSPSTTQRPPTPPTQPAPDPSHPEGQPPTAQPPTAQPPAAQPPAVPPGVPQPAAPQPAVPQPLPPPGRVFGSDSGMIWNPVKPDRTLDFEMVMGRLKEALAHSEDPVRKQQAAGWKLFKALEVGPNNSVLYVFVMDPAVKGADYTISKILNEAFPKEVQELYKLYIGASVGGQVLLNLQLLRNFGEAPKEVPPKEVPPNEVPPNEVPPNEVPPKEAPPNEAPAKEAPAKEAPAKEAPAKEAPARDAPAKDAPAKDPPAKDPPGRSDLRS